MVANDTNFDVILYSTLKGAEVVVERYNDLSNTQTDDNYYATIINAQSRYIKASVGGTLVVKVKTALAGGERKTLIIEIMNKSGTAAMKTYKLAEAWVSKWEASDLDASSSDVAIEKITVQYESFLD